MLKRMADGVYMLVGLVSYSMRILSRYDLEELIED